MARAFVVDDSLPHPLPMAMVHRAASRTAYISAKPYAASMRLDLLSENEEIPLLEIESEAETFKSNHQNKGEKTNMEIHKCSQLKMTVFQCFLCVES